MKILEKVKNYIFRKYQFSSEKRYIGYLRSKGVLIGDNVMVPQPSTVSIDLTRPSLVEIGNNVRLNKNFFLRTHDGGFYVLLERYGEFISSSGRVKIGNNVYFGWDCKVFKGVTIGDNCIIGANSIVTRDIPSNSVAVGAPARVVCSLEEYYVKRKRCHIEEAKDYARSIAERFGRKPKLEEFYEEFPLFLRPGEVPMEIPVARQLGRHFKSYLAKNKPIYESFEEFLVSSGVDIENLEDRE